MRYIIGYTVSRVYHIEVEYVVVYKVEISTAMAKRSNKPHGVAGIYLITCLANSSTYVGQAYDIGIRWSSHIAALRNQRHCNNHLQAIYQKYGEASLKFEVIKTLENTTRDRFDLKELKLLLNSMEQTYLSTILRPNINQTKWVNSPLGIERSEDFIENCSIAQCKKDYVGISPNNEIFYFRRHTKFAKEHGLNPDLIRACGQGKFVHTKNWVFLFQEHAEGIEDLIGYREARLKGYSEEKRLRFRTSKPTKRYLGLSPDDMVYEFEFPSIFAESHGLWSGSINECCKGISGLHKGWVFDFRDNFSGTVEEYKLYAQEKRTKQLIHYKEASRKHSYVGISPDGEIHYFDFVKDFAKDRGFSWTGINKCCKGELKTYDGWVYMYAKNYTSDFDVKKYLENVKVENRLNRIKRANGTKIKYYKGTSPNGRIIYFDNCRDFCRNNNLSCPNMIGRVCSGDRPQYKGWKFQYITKKEFLAFSNNTSGWQSTTIAN